MKNISGLLLSAGLSGRMGTSKALRQALPAILNLQSRKPFHPNQNHFSCSPEMG